MIEYLDPLYQATAVVSMLVGGALGLVARRLIARVDKPRHDTRRGR